MKRELILFIFVVLLFNILGVLAYPQLENITFTSNNGSMAISMPGNLSGGFILDTDNNANTNYEIQFNHTGANEKLKAEMFGLYLINSSVPVSNLKDYYDTRGVPEPFLSYLKK